MSRIEREIISVENVKPCFPPNRLLKRYKLSMLDQINPATPIPVILYFQSNISTSTTVDVLDHKNSLLKSSLSSVLTRFYPLAGRIAQDGLSVDCNGEGTPFVVAKIKGGYKLSDFLKKPDPRLPEYLLPSKISIDTEWGPGDSPTMIQVTHFGCGGMTICAVIWHKVADATAITSFLDSWAASALGKYSGCPNYIGQLLFPQNGEDAFQSRSSLSSICKKGKFIMRRYVFNSSAIKTLRAQVPLMERRPTRVEVVSALLWQCFRVASLRAGKTVSILTQTVNLRKRAFPPFPSEFFGNFLGLAPAWCKNEGEMDLGSLVKELRKSLSKINGEFVNRMLQGDQGVEGWLPAHIWSGIPEGGDLCPISSWCNFGLYKLDFGWGTPVWVTKSDSIVGDSSLSNIWLMDTKDGDGVEAWITLDEERMEIFDSVNQLHDYAASDPSPLDYISTTSQ